MSVRIISNRIPELRSNIDALSGISLSFGYQGDTGQQEYESGITVALNAAIQEFGTDRIPARPFLRQTIEEHGDAIRNVLTEEIGNVANLRKDAIDAMLDAAQTIHGFFLETLDTTPAWATANAAETILKKGHDHPLMGGAAPDDGPVRKLRENLTWAIRRHGSIVAEGR